MRTDNLIRRTTLTALAALLALAPVFAQTRITPPKNPYKPNQDVQLGRQAANEVEQKLPLINDSQIQYYVERVGRRLVNSMPEQYRYPEFEYSFRVVNAQEINAFALPGGFTYVNRGLIEVARNEGELAGVMAHEISHVALRHGTAQYAKGQKYAVGAAAGQILGAIIGGGVGSVVAQGSQLGIGAYFLKFSREYERQADLLGAQMMANAGYDPIDLANMFRTIEEKSGGRSGPEWLSSHPNPGNRYENINREAQALRVRNPIRQSAEFDRVQARLRNLGPVPAGGNASASPRQPNDTRQPDRNIDGRVELPSTRYRNYGGNLFQVGVPANWRELPGQETITFAPEGAYGQVQGRFVFTHGVMMGVARTRSRSLRQATDEFLNELVQGNPQMRAQGNYQRGSIDRREALNVNFINRSEVTGRDEVVSVYTTLLRNGDLFYMIPVAPRNEYNTYQRAFQNVLRSLQLND